jgi:hypothetical protein
VTMLQDIWRRRGGSKAKRRDTNTDDFEFYLIDLSDAFCHFGVLKNELRHCVTPDEHDQDALVWCAMLFGYRAAPLLMGRLSSALGRLFTVFGVSRDDAVAGLCGRHTCGSAGRQSCP